MEKLSRHFPTAAKQQASFTRPLYQGSGSCNVQNHFLFFFIKKKEKPRTTSKVAKVFNVEVKRGSDTAARDPFSRQVVAAGERGDRYCLTIVIIPLCEIT